MSGLCGVVDTSGRPVPQSDLDAMVAAAPYRGRDGCGSWNDGAAAFVYQATHVTPESAREHQPCVDAATGLVVLADARIDNRSALIASLRSTDRHVAADATDLDIVVAALVAWGDDAVSRFVGDFAIVAWNPDQRRLLVALDPMGMRSLAYWWDGTRMVFASEVQQVLAAPGVPTRLFEPAIAAHLVGSFDQPEWTPYDGVLRLAAGHTLVMQDRRSRVFRTWDIDPERGTGLRGEADHVERFRTLFEEAVDARLRCRLPIGALLSGGVDSSSVAAMAGTILRERGEAAAAFRTYSWAFEALRDIDERRVSDIIVDHFGFTSTDVAAEQHWPLSGDPFAEMPLDGPFCSVYQTLIRTALDQARRDGVGLMLVGLRGDVLVGESVSDTLGLLLHGRWRDVWAEVQAYRRLRRTSLRASVRRLLVGPAVSTILPQRSRTGSRRAVGRRRRPPPWVRPEFLERSGLTASPSSRSHIPEGLRDDARQRRYESVFSNVVTTGMAWSEKLHAEAGLAFADPWSDRRLAEFVIAMPQSLVQQLHAPKRLAREAMRGIVPEAARRSLAKVPPYPLYRQALERDAVPVIEALLEEPVSEALGFVDGETLRTHCAAVRSGARDHPGLWPVLTLEIWLRAHHAV